VQVLERLIEKRTVAKAQKEFKITALKLNVAGRRGYPDRMFLIPGGKPFFIEFKRPGSVPTSLQSYTIKNLQNLGYDVEIHNNVEEALQAIGRRMEAARLPKTRG